MNFQRTRPQYPFHEEYKSMNKDEMIEHMLSVQAKGKIVKVALKDRFIYGLGWLRDKNVLLIKFEEHKVDIKRKYKNYKYVEK